MADKQEPQKPTLVQNVMDWSFQIPDTDILLKKKIHRKSTSFKSLAYIENSIFLRNTIYIYICDLTCSQINFKTSKINSTY